MPQSPTIYVFSLGNGGEPSVSPLKTFKQFKVHPLSISPCDTVILDTPSHLWQTAKLSIKTAFKTCIFQNFSIKFELF